jgi:predicted TIM-barrel fold metal-dependent hydrolase
LALACCIAELGIDRIMFAVDYPYNSSAEGVAFVRNALISEADKEKIFHGNADHLLRLGA